MECTSQGLDNGFLDRPEQGRCFSQISACQSQSMLKLLRRKDPVKGVFSVKLIGPCHINTDIRLIPGKSSPDFSSALTEGDGRALIFSQKKMGPAKRAANHLNRKSCFVGRLTAFPNRTFHRHKVIPQNREKEALIPCPVRSASFEGLIGTWHGCIEDGPLSMNETHGMNC